MFKRTIPWFLLAGTIALVVVAGLQASIDSPPQQLTDSERAALRPTSASESAASPASCGDVNANGTTTSADVITLVNYVFKGGAEPVCLGCNLAWGAVTAAGAILDAGSGNWTVTYNAVSDRYEITITDEAYFYSAYHASVTLISPVLKVVGTDSIGGKLIVRIRDGGAYGQQQFTFSVIKS